MKTFGIVGDLEGQGSEVLRSLVEQLSARRLRVSVMAQMAEDFDLDAPGKDSYRHRQAGALEVVISSQRRWAVIHQGRDARPSDPLPRMGSADLLLLYGITGGDHCRIAIVASHEDPVQPGDPRIVAFVAAAKPAGDDARPWFSTDDSAGLCTFIITHCGLQTDETN